MFRKIRESKLTKTVAVFIALNLFLDLFMPALAKAITGGPSQPEVQAFEPVGTDQMVDPFSGDFTYNIPLLDVGGYPVNISYHSGITMEQEASWVGLGWNINPGVINRNMRGVPDDFNGDEIETQYSLKPNVTYGVRGVIGAELFGLDILQGSAGLGINYNTYRGVGMQTILNVGISGGDDSKPSMCANLGLTGGSEGLSISGNLSYARKGKKLNDESYSIGVGSTFCSTEGLKDLSFNLDYSNDLGSSGLNLVKRKEAGVGNVSTGHSISFNSSTYTPSLDMPMINSSISFACKIGLDAVAADAWLNISGYYSRQELYSKSEVANAYGYLYSSNGETDEKAMLDFNREKDGSYMREKPILPLAYMSYDVYSVSGQGIGGVFRPFLSSVGQVFDPKVNNYGAGGSLGGEIGALNIVKGGIDISVNYTQSTSHKWIKNNGLSDILQFGNYSNGSQTASPYYFREVGETSIESDDGFIDAMGGRGVVTPEISGSGYTFSVKPNLYDKNNHALGGSSIKRNVQAKRNQLFIPLNAEQATYFGVEKEINYYTYNNGVYSTASEPRMVTDESKPHHISEITTLRPDGMRYVYGIPAYNHDQREMAFSCEGAKIAGQYVFYTDGVDNVAPNSKGRDGYLKCTVLPDYAYAYLLTSILSADYVDRDAIPGPSKGDLGTYTKFSYVQVKNYKWKNPYDKPGAIGSFAILNEGIKEDKEDDKATYVQGVKDLWFLHKIETKTHVAVFYMSNEARYDACSNDGVKSMKLDSIKLFPIVDYEELQDGATAIKTVHFKYSHRLCTGVWNNFNPTENGKLTLEEIYFTYGNSHKGELNKYKFDYSEKNPPYNPTAFDRWGNYQDYSSTLPNSEFPYTTQDEGDANVNASAWCLTKIDLPSGGSIEVGYESDDYAFVMNKRAKQMISIAGFNSSDAYSASNALYNGTTANNYLFFAKDPAIDIDEYFKDQNGRVDSVLFYRCSVKIIPSSSYSETVSGYAKIKSYKEVTVGSSSYGCIELEGVDIGDRTNPTNGTRIVNPISKAAWQFAQMNMKHLIHATPNGSSTEDILIKLVSGGLIIDIVNAFKGENRVYRDADRGKTIDLAKSFIRLNCPTWSKNGGGARVHTITVNDNWQGMTNEESFSYGQEYDYTTTNNFAFGSEHRISSGVASYEPMLGNEENPFRMPEGYITKRKWVADRDFYIEHPIGESFIPSASVGYSKVTVCNIKHPGVTRHATGKTVYEFYTAYDFPVYFDYTTKYHIEKKPSVLANLFKLNVRDYVAASQGFYIETNDMHGKPKGQSVYAEGENTPISSIKYYYKTLPGSQQRLDTKVNAVDASGEVVQRYISMDMDLTIDAREQKSQTYGGALGGNLASFLLGCIPGIAPTIIPSFSCEKTKFNSITATKVVNCFGVQDSTVAYDLGSRVATKNLLYDAETGSPLLTKTTNEFNDPIYSFTYPVHWAYEGMSPAYKNTLVAGFASVINSGVASINGADEIFFPGDEVDVYDGNHTKAWVGEVGSNYIKIIDKNGYLLGSAANCYIRVIRSGRRNMQSLSMGTVVSSKSPFIGGQLVLNNDTRVISADATQYSDVWQIPGPASDCMIESPCSDCGFSQESFLAFLNSIVESVAYEKIEFKNVSGCTFIQSRSGGSVVCGTYFGNVDVNNQLIMEFSICDDNTTHYAPPMAMTFPVGHSWNNIASFDGITNNTINFSYYTGSTLNTNGVITLNNWMMLPYTCQATDNDYQCYIGTTQNWPPIKNPYYEGLRGVWRQQRTYKYLTGRTQTTATLDNKNIRDDGYFETFAPFWEKTGGGTNSWLANLTNVDWVFTSEVTKYNTMSAEVENKDALQRYSAAQYGYADLMPIAVGKNIMYKEIGFIGFEDKNISYCNIQHFNFEFYKHWVNNSDAHTGWFSLEIPAKRSASMTRCMTPKFPTETSTYSIPFQTNSADFIGLFSPHSNYAQAQKFVVSFWAKPSNATGIMTDYSGISAQFYDDATPITVISMKKSKLINGWQQYEYVIQIDAMADGKFMLALNNQGDYSCHFDDIRIFPFRSNIKCYVYNYRDNKLMAELDENNYATFYEYDQEGKVIRIKKETERGIFTIQQSINHFHSN